MPVLNRIPCAVEYVNLTIGKIFEGHTSREVAELRLDLETDLSLWVVGGISGESYNSIVGTEADATNLGTGVDFCAVMNRDYTMYGSSE
jgi:hypothetical protein